MMKPRRLMVLSAPRSLVVLACALACARAAIACIHAPIEYGKAVREATQEALVFSDGVNAHLVISTQIESTFRWTGRPAQIGAVTGILNRTSLGDRILNSRDEDRFEMLWHAVSESTPVAPALPADWLVTGDQLLSARRDFDSLRLRIRPVTAAAVAILLDLPEGALRAFHRPEALRAELFADLAADPLALPELPGTIGWVIPLPTLPSHYEEVSTDLFPSLYRLTVPRPQLFPGAGVLSAGVRGVVVHPTQVVGHYAITPVEIHDGSAGDELNQWLTQNGFGPVPAENQRYYLAPGHVFLAIKASGFDGQRAHINPLHIVYRSDRLCLPLKFSSHSGIFDVRLYAYTARKLPANMFTTYGLAGGPSVSIDHPDPVLRAVVGGAAGFLTLYQEKGVNGPGRLVADLPEDPSIPASSEVYGNLSVQASRPVTPPVCAPGVRPRNPGRVLTPHRTRRSPAAVRTRIGHRVAAGRTAVSRPAA